MTFPQATCETCCYFSPGSSMREAECRRTAQFQPRAKGDWCGEHPDFHINGKSSVTTLMRPSDFAGDPVLVEYVNDRDDLPPPAKTAKPSIKSSK